MGVPILFDKAFFIKRPSKIEKILHDEVLWIETAYESKYLNIITETRMIKIRSSLKKLKEMLPENQYLQINRTQMVGVHQIGNIHDTKNEIEIGDHILLIGKGFKSEILEKLNIVN